MRGKDRNSAIAGASVRMAGPAAGGDGSTAAIAGVLPPPIGETMHAPYGMILIVRSGNLVHPILPYEYIFVYPALFLPPRRPDVAYW